MNRDGDSVERSDGGWQQAMSGQERPHPQILPIQPSVTEGDDSPDEAARALLLDALAWPDYRTDAPPKWTPLHDLAIVFLSLAYENDGDLSDAEVEMMLNCMERWVNESSESFLFVVMQEAMHHYECGARRYLLETALVGLSRVLTGGQRHALRADLKAVASADGRVSATDRLAIALATSALGLDVPV